MAQDKPARRGTTSGTTPPTTSDSRSGRWARLGRSRREAADTSGEKPAKAGRTPAQEQERERKRFARRQWRRRWLTWKYVVALVTLVGVVAGGVWLVMFSSYLSLEKVSVEGNQLLSKAEIVNAADLPTGEPLARLDLERAGELVSSLSAVKSVDVTREWPRGVRIRVVERTAVAVVQTGQLIRGMDATGTLFRIYTKAPTTLPLVVAGDDTDAAALAEAALVADALPADLNRRVARLTVASKDNIVLQLRGGKQVRWGSAERSDLKAEVLAALLTQEGRVYDVSAPSLPTVSG